MLHAKTATIDFVWWCVGSTNLDSRSFLHNDELDATSLGGSLPSISG
jgi:cardiolipin synthase